MFDDLMYVVDMRMHAKMTILTSTAIASVADGQIVIPSTGSEVSQVTLHYITLRWQNFETKLNVISFFLIRNNSKKMKHYLQKLF